MNIAVFSRQQQQSAPCSRSAKLRGHEFPITYSFQSIPSIATMCNKTLPSLQLTGALEHGACMGCLGWSSIHELAWRCLAVLLLWTHTMLLGWKRSCWLGSMA
eukprot:GHRR01020866.1.p3 GENE.GHRR01020866.1~~GHRR01020866.1.p3  ORF type:complete len:103 (+),score=10.99 GHRR01020866.1:1160-1468(+)